VDSRYSVDDLWLVPHFEKMLYDNALLARAYLHAWQITRNERFRRICEETLDWTLREMRGPEGGFYSALDADSEGEEGKFYIWTEEELRALLGEDAEALLRYWGIDRGPNFEGRSILYVAGSEIDPDTLARAREKLYAVRAERIWPGLDDKRITAWNALMIAALADAGAALGRRDYVDAALACADFIDRDMRDAEGRLLRTYKDGRASLNAYLEDHAFLVEALLVLYEATFETRRFVRARALADSMIERYHDDEGGGFFTTGSDAEALVTRPKDVVDNAVPSANSVLALELQRLAMITGDHAWEDTALEILRLMRDPMARSPLGFAHLLQALDLYTSKPLEIVVVGDRDDAGTGSLLSAVRMRFLPAKVLVASEESGPLADDLPLLEGRTKVDGRAAAYVCTRGTCRRPVTDPGDLVAEIEAA
jgi:uncharacterized protein YyaL (SSP411 family)